MNAWWSSAEAISRALNVLAILVTIFGVATVTLKIRYDQLKKAADAKSTAERNRLDQQLREQTATALEATAALKARQAPRTLTAEQRKKLVQLLSNGPKGKVFVVPKTFDEEAENYAKQISEVLTSAGFELGTLRQRPFSFGRDGVFLWVRDFSKSPPHAAFIQDCFRQFGMTLDGYGDAPQIEDDNVMICVGPKPQT